MGRMTKPLLHFAHGNSFPAGAYRQFLDGLRHEYDVRAIDMHGHHPDYPVADGWHTLTDELIAQLESYGQSVILVGHSLGGLLCAMAAARRPDLTRCVVLLDAPVIAGWRAAFWRAVKTMGFGDRLSPARFSLKRRMVWPDRDAAYQHFIAKPVFAAWAPGVLDDYLDHGLVPHPQGVQLRFSRDIETAIYRSLPHHLGELLDRPFPVPVGFIGGTTSVELAQAGTESTRRLVGANFDCIEGSHLYPMESPQQAARMTREMIARLLG